MSVALQAVRTTVGDTVVGVERPLLLLALPVVIAALVLLVRYRVRGTASTRSRRLLLASRVVMATLLVVAAAGPFTVVTMETQGDPSVSLLVDRSDSMAVSPVDAEGLAADIEREGVPVTVSTIGQGTNSRVGDGIAANLRENGSVVVVSDGQVTGGQRLTETTEFARSLNATISTVRTDPTRTERYVTVSGPSKASVGVESSFLVQVEGVQTSNPVTVSVEIDGQPVATEQIAEGEGSVSVDHTFESTGDHEVTAEIDGDDVYSQNDRALKTVRVVEQPRILYVSRGNYSLQPYLNELYDVETAESVPSNLDPYYAVVVQNVAADDMGNVDELQRFVIDGGGLLVAGGPNSFENGGYANSSIAATLPVTFGESTPGSARIVMLVDVSGSAGTGMEVQKAIALDALSQLDDENTVGVVGFNHQAYSVVEPATLSQNRDTVEDRIRRLRAGGATNIANGLRGAEEMLGGQRGTIILISDGADTESRSDVVASTLGRQGIQVVAIGAGRNVNERVLRRVAEESGGNYFRANETDRLRLLFGGGSRQFQGDGLTVVDSSHFITSGVTLESNPGQVNDVSMRPGANFLVATPDGTPAVASWRYGLGRVATITTYGSDGGLDGLLQRPDSLLVSKSVNYAIGDPERKASGVTDVSDTRIGQPTTVVYRGERPPSGTTLTFSAVDDGVYRAQVTPTEVGFHDAAGATYAANAHAEYAGFGTSTALTEAVRSTGGQRFDRGQTAQIAAFARQQSTRVRDVRQTWDWAFVVAALLLFVTEVVVRRLQVYNGRTSRESGLP
ncbi:von Willebrand factor type A domain-containing protein [Haloplanus vescus]|uniref:von Willebrand factor type A domain-containing protein n=1 Tax=Haloplanus vescus TaxID=555874 RepID=A0A1H3VL08_9EURY|nr:VWA domain-containing protein [Haloplanus vescus]SDZ75371.1 von Willebrand factor type A domain-containing protein [Haloplanus vescus]